MPTNSTPLKNGHRPHADLRAMMDMNPLPALETGLINPESMTGGKATTQAGVVLDRLNAALVPGDAKALESCFYTDQAYWKDQLAFTWHLRTFRGPGTIATRLLETAKLRCLAGIEVDGTAVFLPATPVLQFIDCPIIFRTGSPAALGRGKILLLPVDDGGDIVWRIWILSTRLESLDIQPEDEMFLQSPKRPLDGAPHFETDVFIIGAGNAAVTLSARLKAMAVDSVMVDRNAHPGDNWALRYDCMQFHLPTSFCEMPYMYYDKELQNPHLLSKDDLASQVRRYVESFNLNTIHSAQVQWTEYDTVARTWSITIQTPAGQYRAVSKHLVMATGLGSQKPYIPSVEDTGLYRGVSIHSAEYKNAEALKERGVKSVVIVGSANTAFDVLADCHGAGLAAIMVVRSPTYIVPLEYICHRLSLGAYDAGVDSADNLFLSLPTVVDSQLGRALFAMFAANEPERYAELETAGFPVLDSRQPSCALMSNLLERAGGHYVDVGGTKLIEEKKVDVKALVEPIGYTKKGLRFSDGTSLDADAIIWCTGFADLNAVDTVAEILGDGNAVVNEKQQYILTPRDVASRIDATWGLDEEGEVRGMWKRHHNADNFWIMGGYTQQHRWHSRTLALQINAALEGILPPAYKVI